MARGTEPPHSGREAELRPVLPLRTPGHAFRQYTSAIRYLSPPGLFENRPSYRLLGVSWETSGQGKLQFGLATYFDKLDVSEALSHEFAAATMEGAPPAWRQLPFLARLSQPFDLSSRMGCTSIATLTIRRDTTDGSCTFFLLGRDPQKVATGGQVVTSFGDDQSVHGLPFTEATVRQFLDREPLGGTSAACLALT